MNYINKTKKTTIINLFGGPGAGKSTAAALIYARMKFRGLSCEYVPEFAKELAYVADRETLENQFYVSAIQFHRQHKLIGRVDYIVTDSPILLGKIYNNQFDGLGSLLEEIHRKTYSVNVFLRRDKDDVFEQEGRIHNYKESVYIDMEIEKMLIEHDVHYASVQAKDTEFMIDVIFGALGI
jgi:hypothetical protein